MDRHQVVLSQAKAIKVANQLVGISQTVTHSTVAHFHCELAEIANRKQNFDVAYKHLKRALSADRNCVRASLLQGEYALVACNYKAAVKAFKLVKSQDPDFLCEAIPSLMTSYRALGDSRRCFDFLWECLAEYPSVSVILALTELISQRDGDELATQFLSEQLAQHPSLRGLSKLARLYAAQSNADSRSPLKLLQQLLNQFVKDKPSYRCVQCGFSASKLYWHCPGCKNWSTVRPIHGIEGEGGGS